MGEEDRHPKWFTDLAEEAKRVQRVRLFLQQREREHQTAGETVLLREIRLIVET
jgi:hypothetical protein